MLDPISTGNKARTAGKDVPGVKKNFAQPRRSTRFQKIGPNGVSEGFHQRGLQVRLKSITQNDFMVNFLTF